MFWRPAVASVPSHLQHSATPVLLVPAYMPINLQFLYLVGGINDRKSRWKKSRNWILYLNSSTEASGETALFSLLQSRKEFVKAADASH